MTKAKRKGRSSWRRSRCIEWSGTINSSGYGIVKTGINKYKMAHRVIYEGVYGKIPVGLVIDHLCKNKPCVNIKHIEVVTIKENTLRGDGPTARNLRKTHCSRGHELKGVNSKNERVCKPCKNILQLAYRAKGHRHQYDQASSSCSCMNLCDHPFNYSCRCGKPKPKVNGRG